MKTGKAILGILIASAAGALLGMLYAPHKGADARKKISETGKEYADSMKKKFDETLDGITEKFNKAKDEVSDFAHQTRKKY
jgi:gas vesicle protein